MLDNDQKQTVEAGSTAIQAGGNVTITQSGLSYSDVQAIATDVYNANFYKLSSNAKEIARDRAEEITEEFLSKLQKEYPAGFEKAQDPDFQCALFTVQKEYARSGDKDLGALLVDLLVDRCKQNKRDILQIVLNESLNTAPKLTENQLAILAIIFLFKYTQNSTVVSIEKLGEYFDKYVKTFAAKLVKNLASYQHLQYSGCGSIEMGAFQLESVLSKTYQGIFLKGFDSNVLLEQEISIGSDANLLIPCLNDSSKLQINAMNKQMLEQLLESHGISNEERRKITALFDLGKMNDDEIKKKCIEIRPYMSDIFECWSVSAMKNFTLTSVGIAIGHANIKRLTGEFADLAIWIN